MKIVLTSLALIVTALAASAASPGPVYELRTYHAEPVKFDALISRLTAASELFAKHGMENIIYWKTEEKDGAQSKVVYVLGHKDRQAAAASWRAFLDDPAWHGLRDANEANGKVVSKVDSVFLSPTEYSPPVNTGGKSGGVYELRTYIAPEGKLDALDARFRNHTMKLFENHGMINGPYFHPVDAAKGAGKTLIYWLAHDSREAAAASWKGFSADPAWIAARNASEVDGKLTAEVKSVYLRTLDFSPLK